MPLPEHLVTELRAGRVIAFIGAGFSAPAGFPGWKNLLLEIAEQAEADGALPAEVRALVVSLLSAQWPSATELDQAAQQIDDALPSAAPQERLVGYMRRFLVPSAYPLPPVMERRLELLRSLPFRAILTTNFNPLISGVTPFDPGAPAAAPCTPSELPPAESSAVATSDAYGLRFVPTCCPVLQIHGSLRLPRSVVFTREGYRRLLYQQPHYHTFVKASLSAYTVLYMGFSFSDAYLNELRSEIVSLLGDGGAPIAYAITNDKSELQRKFFQKHEGVEMLNFDTSAPGGWGGFDAILEELDAAAKKT